MSGQKQRTTFAKQQRERARMEKAAEKRKRREERKLGIEEPAGDGRLHSDVIDPNDPYTWRSTSRAGASSPSTTLLVDRGRVIRTVPVQTKEIRWLQAL